MCHLQDVQKDTDIAAIKYINALKKSADRLRRQYDESGEGIPDENQRRAFWEDCIVSNTAIHKQADNLILLLPSVEREKVFSKIAEQEGIEVKVEDGAMYVCVPHPPHKIRYRKYSFTDFSWCLRNEIEKHISDIDFAPQKDLFLMNVYPQDTNVARFFDFDNYDTKSIIDSVTDIYPGADSPATTRMTLQTVLSDEVAPMTYIAVIPNRGWRDISTSNIRKKLFQMFPWKPRTMGPETR